MKVFISHSSKNKKVAGRLCDDLAGKRIRVWLDRDELRVGDPLIDEMQDALEASSHLILLWSKPASESRYVKAEWQAAYDLEKVMIPCLLDKTPLPLFLRRLKFCDLRNSYGRGWVQIIQALRGDSAALKPKAVPERPEPTPDKQAVIDELYLGQEKVTGALGAEDLASASGLQKKLDPVIKDALRRWRSDETILNLGGYHLKNAYLIKYRHEMSERHYPPDPLLGKAEQLFHAALGIQPDDPAAKNGLGNIYWLRRNLDAAEFFVKHAITKAQKEGYRYEAAEQDLKGIRQDKAAIARRSRGKRTE